MCSCEAAGEGRKHFLGPCGGEKKGAVPKKRKEGDLGTRVKKKSVRHHGTGEGKREGFSWGIPGKKKGGGGYTHEAGNTRKKTLPQSSQGGRKKGRSLINRPRKEGSPFLDMERNPKYNTFLYQRDTLEKGEKCFPKFEGDPTVFFWEKKKKRKGGIYFRAKESSTQTPSTGGRGGLS